MLKLEILSWSLFRDESKIQQFRKQQLKPHADEKPEERQIAFPVPIAWFQVSIPEKPSNK
ncbi:MAG: hypothetical protein L3J31_08420 [Bacteroidales bacterium]|nr:hypothetical protein [Bacteroidales bacterium]MCF6342813.1 hypothetical protein [Bacteroidales bacterium]